jgi:flagellar hook assembly protein FlgD
MDQAGNVKNDTLRMTVVFDSDEIVSDVYNFPNPFSTASSNPGTTIRYMLTSDITKLRFIILDGAGKVVKEMDLDDSYKTSGTHYYHFNGKNNMGYFLGSGVYYGFLEIDGNVTNRIKMAIFNK